MNDSLATHGVPKPARIRVRLIEFPTRPAGYRELAEPPRAILSLGWSAFSFFNFTMMLVLAFAIWTALDNLVPAASPLWLALSAYLLAASLLGRVEVRSDGERIVSRFSPPLFPSKTIPVADVLRIVATQSVASGRWSESTNAAWYVVAHTTADREHVITRLLRKREEAVFVARTLEAHLGLSPSSASDDPE